MSYVENYSVNGTSLDNHKYAIESVTTNIPSLKGENLVPAMDHGSRWRRKRLASTTETWTIWVSDNLASTGLPPSTAAGRRAAFNANLDELLSLLTTTHTATGFHAPLKIVRKLKTNSSSPSDIYRVNYGEVVGGAAVTRSLDNETAKLSVTISYPDPRWYESNSSGTKTSSTLTADGNPGGTALMTRMTITLGSASNPYIQNVTTGSKITWSGGSPGGSLVIDTYGYTAKVGSNSVVGNIDRTGSTTTDWFILRPGVTNDLESNTSYSISYCKAFL